MVRLQHFDRQWAEKLIRETAEEHKVGFPPALIDQMYQLTAGNPYLIKVICRQIVEALRLGERSTVTQADLDGFINFVVAEGHLYLNHYVAELSQTEKAVLVELSLVDAGRPLGELRDDMQRVYGRAQGDVRDAIRRLERRGLLVWEHAGGEEWIRFALDLLRRWAAAYL